MEGSVGDEYFTMQVLTAPVQKLHLMLIEAAIRATQQAQALWDDEDRGLACEALLRAQECVAQMLAGLNLQAGELAHKLAALYTFVLRRLRDANLQRNRQALDEALKILKMEQHTWQVFCEQTSRSDTLSPTHSPESQAFSFQA
ncbi:MAG: flagellar protein FliS [Thermoguttaceae bacterium]|nr:flagellar protein FliS [Thermoguttaceae bacterium]MDW8038931.1 flagellar export chaperone FliS [Thermoguttaceae bacterium]